MLPSKISILPNMQPSYPQLTLFRLPAHTTDEEHQWCEPHTQDDRQPIIGSLPTLLLQIELLIILFVAPHPLIMIRPYMPTYLNINTVEMSQCREDTNQTPTPATNDDHLGPRQRRIVQGS